jgi:1A family penicillin-binding protein
MKTVRRIKAFSETTIAKAKKIELDRSKMPLIIGSAFFIFCGLFALWISTLKIPDLSSLESRKVVESTKIYDRTGTILLYDVHDSAVRTTVPFEDISIYVKNATVAIEDSTFYTNSGIKITSIIRSFLANLFSGSFSQGGSTITQQVIKNSLLTNEKSISRKIKEWVLALELEKVMSKEEILSIYLNEIPYGGNIYGVEEAAETFFNKKASDLDLAESAYLAAIPQAPTFYSPYGQNLDKLAERKNLVLQRMLDNKFITEDEFNQAKAEKVTFSPKPTYGVVAPHFVEFIKQYLANKYGEEALQQNGYKVITTLDFSLQTQMEAAVKNYVDNNQANFNMSNAAAVAIDPKTGQILAMVGSRDYFSTSTDGKFNVAISPNRQPGSTFKPFIYETAFEKGYTPDTVLFDVPTEFQSTCNPDGTPKDPSAIIASSDACYTPQDFDGLYRGPVSLRTALALSLNIPSIKLFYLAGQKDVLDKAQAMGITTLGDDPNQYGLTLVLGSGGVSLLDLTSAYGVFANDGVRNSDTGIISIQDSAGNVVESFATNSDQVIPSQDAELVSDVLSDNVAKAPEYGATGSVFMFPGREVAAKTGTTNDSRDAWTVGYTPDVVVGVWGGNNDNTPMHKNIAGLIIAPLWRQLMGIAMASTTPDDFVKPKPYDPNLKPALRGIWQGDQTYFIDSVSGKLATDMTPPETKKEIAIPNPHSILYWVNKNDPTGPDPIDPTLDSQYNSWEYSVQQWLSANPQKFSVKPVAYDDVHVPANIPTATFLLPRPDAAYDKDARVTIVPLVSAHYPIGKIDYYLNDEFIGTSSNSPYTISFVPSSANNLLLTGNKIRAEIYDSVYNKGEAETNLNIQ